MTAEKHAEAAANEIASWLRKEAHLFPSDGNIAEWAKLIGHHSQSAIDEATAPLKGRIAKLEGLGPMIDKCRSLAYLTGSRRASGDADWKMVREQMIEVNVQIDAILKGES
jgi:hypothetical protein